MTPRPIALTVNPSGIPDALKAERRWVCWRYEWKQDEGKKGRWSKILCTTSGYHAKSNDSTTWTTFKAAFAAYSKGNFDGIGFCLGDGWAGIDFDHCRHTDDAETNIAGFLWRDRLDCYVEISPSGTGYKAIGRAPRIGGQIDLAGKKLAFTTWSTARFFATTGHVIGGQATWDITALIDEWFPPKTSGPILRDKLPDRPSYIHEGDTRGTENIVLKTDDEVLLLAATAVNREKFLKLFRGDISDYGDDRSRADQALVNILYYWCNGNVEQVDRLFRESALMRDKWDTESYRRSTLNKAMIMEGV